MERFDCQTIDAAKAIILTPELDLTPEERWERETAWLKPKLIFDVGTIMDFGCGIGRLAKEVVSDLCPVVGVDSSESMRRLAPEYVGSEHFRVSSPERLDEIETGHFRGGIAAWVLQHVRDPAFEIARLARVLAPKAPLYVVNRFHRAVPSGNDSWLDDGVSIGPVLMMYFNLEFAEAVPTDLCAEGAYFARWVRK